MDNLTQHLSLKYIKTLDNNRNLIFYIMYYPMTYIIKINNLAESCNQD